MPEITPLSGDGSPIEPLGEGCDGTIERLTCGTPPNVVAISLGPLFQLGEPTVIPGEVTIVHASLGPLARFGLHSVIQGDPPGCQLCAGWMTANGNASVGGETGFALHADYPGGFIPNETTPAGAEEAPGVTLAQAIENVQKYRDIIDEAGLCEVEAGSNFLVYVVSSDPSFGVDGVAVMTISEFLALPVHLYKPEVTWQVYFRCGDQ